MLNIFMTFQKYPSVSSLLLVQHAGRKDIPLSARAPVQRAPDHRRKPSESQQGGSQKKDKDASKISVTYRRYYLVHAVSVQRGAAVVVFEATTGTQTLASSRARAKLTPSAGLEYTHILLLCLHRHQPGGSVWRIVRTALPVPVLLRCGTTKLGKLSRLCWYLASDCSRSWRSGCPATSATRTHTAS